VFSHVEAHQDEYVARLAECVAIPGVSCETARRPEIVRTMEWTRAWCERLNATSTELVDIGVQTLPDGGSIPLPPVLLAQFGEDPAKKTLVVYGHLDVQPAAKADGWDTEPFVLTEVDGKLYGRGVFAVGYSHACSFHAWVGALADEQAVSYDSLVEREGHMLLNGTIPVSPLCPAHAPSNRASTHL